jgi:hypothetical protein
MWQLPFLAMSVTLGESLEDALRALGDEAVNVSTLVTALQSDSREKRARALAEHLAPIAASAAALELTWRG